MFILKKLFLIILSFLFFLPIFAQEKLDTLEVNICAKNYQKMKFLVAIVGEPDQELTNFVQTLKKDLETNFDVVIENIDKLKSKKDLKRLEDLGYTLGLFIDRISRTFIEWRLYDIAQFNMLKGKKINYSCNNKIENMAHSLADELWPDITCQEGSFSSMIAACKKMHLKNKSYHSSIYIFHPTDDLEKDLDPLVSEPTIFVSTRWHNLRPTVYYSKHTNYNVRLMSVDLFKNKQIVANFEGLNLTPSFSPLGNIILLLTRNGKSRVCKYKFDLKRKKGLYIPLTTNSIHAISPSFIDENRIVFCAIDSANKPKIAILHLDKNNKIEYITESGYCVSPCYSLKNGKIAYCKKVQGYLQLFLYDLNTQNHRQVTFDKGDKDSCSWSPCGNYLVFSVENKKESRICIFNLISNQNRFISPKNEYWCYPSWSPVYNKF